MMSVEATLINNLLLKPQLGEKGKLQETHLTTHVYLRRHVGVCL